MKIKNSTSGIIRYVLGLGLILMGVLGVLETSFFHNRAYGVMGIAMLIAALDHIYMIFTKENRYFNWKMVALGTAVELGIVTMIFITEFVNKNVVVNIVIGCFLAIKGIILILGNKREDSEDKKVSKVLRVIAFIKGLFLFLIGALVIILPIINGRIAMVFGWYIMFMGINFISYPIISHYRGLKKEENLEEII